MAVGNCILYIKGEQNVEVQAKDVTLGDVLSMECTNASVVSKLKTIRLLRVHQEGKHRFVVSILKIIQVIHEEYSELEIQNLGPTDIIITYEPPKKTNKILYWGKVIGVSLITFAGAAYSIMSFQNDVNSPKLFDQIYELVMGQPPTGFTILEFMYSVGVVIGIFVFFNHFGKKRFSVDPTPLEVEMRTYENDIQTTVIETYSRKGQEQDVE